MKKNEEAIIFLEGVRKHLYGDLENFERICEEAEMKEASNISCSPTTTSQTTLAPDFIYSKTEKNLFYRSTIPHILSVFSTIDLVGFLLGDWSVVPTKTEDNFNKFFSNDITELNVKYLTFFYRNGMTHTFYPKKKFGISAQSSNDDYLFLMENDTVVLNANYLIKITKKRLNLILKDASLIDNIKNQFIKLEEHDNTKITGKMDLEAFKKELKNRHIK